MTKYSLTSDWTFDAPIERVWDAITHPLQWPEWWPGVEKVVELEPGGQDGLGGVHRSTWESVFPYRLTFDSRVTRVERFDICEVQATGELQGHGVWTLSRAAATTCVRYDWDVVASKWWMERLAPVARPLFRWNHDVIMRWGQKGLAARLRRAAENLEGGADR